MIATIFKYGFMLTYSVIQSSYDVCEYVVDSTKNFIRRMGNRPHWKNPWEKEVVYVPIEELAACSYGLGQYFINGDGEPEILTVENVLQHWRAGSTGPLDAYILPSNMGRHCMGIRYGNEGSEYLSPMGDEEKLTALLRKYR